MRHHNICCSMKPAAQCTTVHVGNPGFDVISVTAARAQTGPETFRPASIFGSLQPEPSSLPQRLYVLVNSPFSQKLPQDAKTSSLPPLSGFMSGFPNLTQRPFEEVGVRLHILVNRLSDVQIFADVSDRLVMYRRARKRRCSSSLVGMNKTCSEFLGPGMIVNQDET